MLVNKLTSGPNMPVQFYLFTRPDKQGDHPINVSISLFGERLCTSVGYERLEAIEKKLTKDEFRSELATLIKRKGESF